MTSTASLASVVPAFGLGTFRLKDEVVRHSVGQALEVGYRAIDTAQIYGNEADVGPPSPPAPYRAISCSSPPRSGPRTCPPTR